MARWVPFLALTASVLLLLLGLARLSSGFVRDSDSSDAVGSERHATPDGSPSRVNAVRRKGRSPTRPADSGESTPTDRLDSSPADGLDSTAVDGRDSTTVDDRDSTPNGELNSTATDSPESTPADRSATATAHSDAERQSARNFNRTGSAEPLSDAQSESPIPNTPGDQTEFSTTMLLANVAITQGLFGAILLGGMFIFDIPARAVGVTSGPWVVGLPAVGIGLFFGALLWGANETVATIADAVGAGYDEGVRDMLAPKSLQGWAVLFALVLPVIAFVEEFIFRAAVIGVTSAGFGISPWVLAVVSSVAFALGHGAQGRVGIVVTGTLGFALAAGFVVSGSLLLVVVAHYVVNALEFLVHEGFGVERPTV